MVLYGTALLIAQFRNGTVLTHRIIVALFTQRLNAILYVCTSVNLANRKRCFALFLMLAKFCTILMQTYSSSQSLLMVVVGSAREPERVCIHRRIYLVS